MPNKNKVSWVNDTDKNLGAASADTCDVKSECGRQLYDAYTYNIDQRRKKWIYSKCKIPTTNNCGKTSI